MTAADDPKAPVTGGPQSGEDGGQDERPGESAEQTIDRLSKALAEKTAEAAASQDRYLRERAELENYRRRMQREQAESLRYASAQLVKDLAEVLDNLERAVEHAESGGNGQPLVEGVRLVLRNALDVLAKHGITRIEAAGHPFDPSRHEAIATVPDSRRQPNQVVEQFQPGYALHDRIIRPAKVSVSTKPTVETPPADD